MKSVSVVIANWDGRHLLERFLPLVLCALREQDEVIIVDNGSRDGSLEWLRERFACVRVVALPKNYGFSVANNIGVKVARGEIVVLLNNDMAPERGFLEPMLRHFDDPTVFAVGAKLLHFDGSPDHANRTRLTVSGGFLSIVSERDRQRLDLVTEPEDQMHAQGGGSAFDREKFLALGGFDPIFSPAYFEDVDLSLRALQRGWRILYEPNSIVWHLGGQTGRVRARWFFELLSFRNFWLYNFLNAPTGWWLSWQVANWLKWLIPEVLCGDFLTHNFAAVLLLRCWWGIVKRRWRAPRFAVDQLVALLRAQPISRVEDSPSIRSLPDRPFVLLVAPAYEGDRVVLQMAADAARQRWGLPVALIIRPGQEAYFQREGIADIVIPFLPGDRHLPLPTFRHLLYWLLRSPCQQLVIPSPIFSPSKGKFVLMGWLVSLLGRRPLWEWRKGKWRRMAFSQLLFRLPLLGAMLPIQLFMAAALLSTEALAAILRRLCPLSVDEPSGGRL
jgi:GT2 family glycosyltransferase